MKWHWQQFNGTDWDQRGQKHALFKIVDPPESRPRPGVAAGSETQRKDWADDVTNEKGNYDYLMFSNIDYRNPEARRDVINWGQWMVHDIGLGGFRLDAVQHYSWHFARDWIKTVKDAGGSLDREIFVVGEFWTGDTKRLVQWLDRMGQGVRAFDSPLLGNFSRISRARLTTKNNQNRFGMRLSNWDVDLRRIFRNSLVEARPHGAVVSAPHRTT